MSQLTEGLKCHGLLQVVMKNSSLFYFIFCPNEKLIWDFKSFTDMLMPVFSGDVRNDRERGERSESVQKIP